MCIIRAVPQFTFANLFTDLQMHPPETRCAKEKSKDSPVARREGDVFTVCTQCKRILVPARKNSAPALRVSSDDDQWMSFEDISNSQAVPIANLSHGLCAACFQRMDALVDALPPSFPTPIVPTTARKPPTRAASSPQLPIKPSSPSTPSAPMRVLVVDDNRLQRQIHKRMVEQAGFPCDVASSASQALEMVQKHSYSLVLMDLMMEGTDGWSGAKAIRRKMLQTVGYSGIPKIVAVTGLHVDSKLIDECAEAGMDDIMHKPVSPPVLTKLLNRYAGL